MPAACRDTSSFWLPCRWRVELAALRSPLFGWLPLMGVLMVSLLATQPLTGQDNPFGNDPFGGDAAPPAGGLFGGDDAGQPPTAEQPAAGGLEPLPRDANIVLRTLREDPPAGAIDLARAARLTARLGAWSEADRYLGQLAPLVTDDAAALQLSQMYGTDFWYSLAREDQLNEASRALAQRVLDVTARNNLDPQSIEASLQQLASASALDRKRAALRLQAAGDAGLRAIVSALADGTLAASPIVVDLIDSFGRKGHDALAAALTVDDPARRQRVLFAATAFVTRGLLPNVAAGVYDPAVDSDSAAAEAAWQAFERLGYDRPSQSGVRQFAYLRLRDDLTSHRGLRGAADDEALSETWTIDSTDSRLKYISTTRSIYYLQAATNLAIPLLRMPPTGDRIEQVAAATLLQRDWAFAIVESDMPLDLRTDQPLGGRRELFGSRTNSVLFWASVYAVAAEQSLPAAQLRCVQHFQNLAEQVDDADKATIISVLENAAETGIPAVRLAASEALLRIETLRPSAALISQRPLSVDLGDIVSGQPIALVVGGAPDLRSLMMTQLESIGVHAVPASTGREAIATIRSDAAIEMVFLVDRVIDMTPSQLVQRLAAYPPTSQIPIAVMTRLLTPGERAILRDEPQVVYGTLTNTDGYLLPFVQRLNRSAAMPLPSRTDRIFWAGMFE